MTIKNYIKGSVAAVVALATVTFIYPFEGRNLVSFLDPVGIPTICDGTTKGVVLGQVATPQQCDDMTKRDVTYALYVVDRAVKAPQPDTRRAALASFVYNVGPQPFLKSTLLRKLNAGDVVGACNQLTRFVYAKGKKLNGLVRRREAEKKLCLEGISS